MKPSKFHGDFWMFLCFQVDQIYEADRSLQESELIICTELLGRRGRIIPSASCDEFFFFWVDSYAMSSRESLARGGKNNQKLMKHEFWLAGSWYMLLSFFP